MKKLLFLFAASICLLTSCNPKSSSVEPQIVIDPTLQSILAHHVNAIAEEIHPQWGLGCLMDLQSNTICALHSTDTDNNYALIDMEMGTIMLPFTVLSALNTNTIPLDTTFLHPAPVRIRDANKYSDSDTTYQVRDIIAVSQGLLTDELVEIAFHDNPLLMQDFFYQSLGIQLSPNSQELSYQDLVNRSVGYHYTTTPLHLLSLYGKLALQQLECDTAAQQLICQGLHDVVWNNDLGTASVNLWGGRKAQSDIVSIAGKTGTVQVSENGTYTYNKHRISFVGYFPEDNPRYVCLVIINAPSRFPYDAGTTCGGCVRKIAEDIYCQ